MTPIDFSCDNKKLIVKEKIGYRHDGIWQTDLWVYDFDKKQGKKLPQIRDAIINYWAKNEGVDFEENRWDIYPMGFDANDDDRVIVCAYAYTGDVPKFLGTWSIDTEGENSRLESLEGASIPVSVIGYRLAEDSVKDASEVEFEARQAKKLEKAKEAQAKEEKKLDDRVKRLEYQRKIHEMDMDVYYKLRERKLEQKNLKKESKGKAKESLTGAQ